MPTNRSGGKQISVCVDRLLCASVELSRFHPYRLVYVVSWDGGQGEMRNHFVMEFGEVPG